MSSLGRVCCGAWEGCSDVTCVLQHHPLEAGIVHDGRARPRLYWGRGHRLGGAAAEPGMEEAHVRCPALVHHLQA